MEQVVDRCHHKSYLCYNQYNKENIRDFKNEDDLTIMMTSKNVDLDKLNNENILNQIKNRNPVLVDKKPE